MCQYTQPVVHWAWAPVLTKVCMLCCMCGGVVTVVLEAVRVCTWIDRSWKARHAHKVWPYLVYAWPYLCVCAAAPLLSLKGTASKDTLALQMKHMFFGLD